MWGKKVQVHVWVFLLQSCGFSKQHEMPRDDYIWGATAVESLTDSVESY